MEDLDVEKLKQMLRESCGDEKEVNPFDEDVFIKDDRPRVPQTAEERDRIIRELKELNVVDTSLPPGSSLDDYQCIIDCIKEADSKFGSIEDLKKRVK
jgi:hypothetical protein